VGVGVEILKSPSQTDISFRLAQYDVVPYAFPNAFFFRHESASY
jgi:hypothetical protein